MDEPRPLPPGTVVWVDLATPDAAVSRAFYATLFDWEVDELGPEAGGYAIFTLAGMPVAGIGPTPALDVPSAWTVHIGVDDAEASAARARIAGGSVLAGPMDVLDAGRLALVADPTGARFALWEGWRNPGAPFAQASGHPCWAELETRDEPAAAAFYPALFGWSARTDEAPGAARYTEWMLDGRPVAGMMAMPSGVPAEVPSHWLVYIAVLDCDALVARAAVHGATTLAPAMDAGPGRFAVLRDPTGAPFAAIALHRPIS